MRRLDQTIADIEAQTVKPAEIIITDAGSKDGTYERLLRWAQESPISIKVLQEPRCNVARGRNLAIAQASHDLIASTDFGCRFEPGWLESIITPFAEDATLDVAGGAFTIIRKEVDNDAARADYILSDGYAVKMDDYFSVSSRSIAYRKKVWEQIGGYPEWLTLAADDTIFWRHVKRLRFKYRMVHAPLVYWLRHKTFKGFGKEAFRYGLGDGESGINFRNFLVHVAETALRWLFFLSLVLLPLTLWLFGAWALIPTAVFALGLRAYRYAFRMWSKAKAAGMDWRPWDKTGGKPFNFKDLFNCFWMIEVTRIYYIRGYIKGWLFARPDQKAARKQLLTQIS